MNIIKKIFFANKKSNLTNKEQNSLSDLRDSTKEWFIQSMDFEYTPKTKIKLNYPKLILWYLLMDSRYEWKDIEKADFESLDIEQKEKYRSIKGEIHMLSKYREDFGPLFNRDEIEEWIDWLVNEKEIYILFLDIYNTYIDTYNEQVKMYNRFLPLYDIEEIKIEDESKN